MNPLLGYPGIILCRFSYQYEQVAIVGKVGIAVTFKLQVLLASGLGKQLRMACIWNHCNVIHGMCILLNIIYNKILKYQEILLNLVPVKGSTIHRNRVVLTVHQWYTNIIPIKYINTSQIY